MANKQRLLRLRDTAVLIFVAAGLLPSSLRAQTSTKDKIDQAVALYERFEIESARPLLQEVLSATWLQPVSLEQRVTAYKYLGASYAVIGKKDTAVNYFTAALAYDAFTDLDRNKFTPPELTAFDFAKTLTFKVGMKPLPARVIDPKSGDASQSGYSIRITTTQRAEIAVTVAFKRPGGTGDSLTEEFFRGTNDGTRELVWRGTIGGHIAPAGNYEMRLAAVSSQLGASRDSTKEKLDFSVRQSFEPLEDTLPALGLRDTVVASYNPRDPLWDFVKGASLGLAVGALSKIALDNSKIEKTDRGTWDAHWTIASGVGVGAGLFSFSYRRQRLLRPEAVAENAKRRQMRAAFNQNVRLRNADRLDKTKLIIQPR